VTNIRGVLSLGKDIRQAKVYAYPKILNVEQERIREEIPSSRA
jgi:hypothetical protein